MTTAADDYMTDHWRLEEELEKWLNAPDPKEKQARSSGLRHDATCRWLLEHPNFVDWEDHPGSLLWIEGPSGSGKTILSSTVIEQLSQRLDHKTAIAYFYFEFIDNSKQSMEIALRRLILQLSRQCPNPHGMLSEKHHMSHGQGVTVPSWIDLLALLRNLLSELHRAYIILDALDECDNYDQIVTFVQKIVSWPSIRLHVLVASQPRDIFATGFASLDNLLKIRIQKDMTSHDITLFVSSSLASSSRLKAWKSKSDTITSRIVGRSAGMFRLAYCLLQELEKCKKPAELEARLEELPRTLHDIYARWLSPEALSPEYLPDAEKLLCWIAFSARPLTVAELEDTIAFNFADPTHFVFDPTRRTIRGSFAEWLSGLISITHGSSESLYNADDFLRDDCIVSLAHSSVLDYLTSSSGHLTRCTSCPIRISEGGAHPLLAQTCVDYLLHFANLTHDLDPKEFPKYPLSLYAAKYWDYHLLRCKKPSLLLSVMLLLERKSRQHLALVKLDVSRESDITANPLCLCCEVGYVDGVEFLRKYGPGRIRHVRDVSDEDTESEDDAYDEDTESEDDSYMYEDSDEDSDEAQLGLCLASRNGHTEVVRALLDSGVAPGEEPEDYEYEDDYALSAAADGGHIEIVRLLISSGADINERGYESALVAACLGGHLDIVSLVIANCAPVPMGRALQAAAARGAIDIVRLLLEKNADVNEPDYWDGTALQAAISSFHIDIEFLLIEGADVKSNGLTGELYPYGCCTALAIAAYKGKTDLVLFLLKNNANPTDGYALPAACAGRTEIVRLLLDNGTDVNAQYGSDPNALWRACHSSRKEVVQLLLDRGADVNQMSGIPGETALICASRGSDPEIVRLLLQSGADINATRPYDGMTALQAALRVETKGEIVRVLLENGADPGIIPFR
ncbi:ankyrin repeat-containing domain protein [Mycena pura]|uniref:Ankyrin repeat-containing domain protein n=1 Tax=Mycena pura TaxID=153505 RepID=A0AAD6VCF2_9AGAR|nr:ankyrin repeat-containing domain protein [Mycena pura]